MLSDFFLNEYGKHLGATQHIGNKSENEFPDMNFQNCSPGSQVGG
jgi:hypothetical protein